MSFPKNMFFWGAYENEKPYKLFFAKVVFCKNNLLKNNNTSETSKRRTLLFAMFRPSHPTVQWTDCIFNTENSNYISRVDISHQVSNLNLQRCSTAMNQLVLTVLSCFSVFLVQWVHLQELSDVFAFLIMVSSCCFFLLMWCCLVFPIFWLFFRFCKFAMIFSFFLILAIFAVCFWTICGGFHCFGKKYGFP